MLQTLGLEVAKDYSTVEFLGNTGSVALPISMALGIENGHLQKDDHTALLGIGSGVNCLMLGVDCQEQITSRTTEGQLTSADSQTR